MPAELVLFCGPNLGMLDNWLPILYAAKTAHPDWKITAVLPDSTMVGQLNPDDTAHRLADDIIDRSIAPLVDGGWMEVGGFLAAVTATRPHPIAGRLSTTLRGRLRRLRPILRIFRSREQRTSTTSLVDLQNPRTRLLYDIHLHGKPAITPLLHQIGGVARFSVHHGLSLEKISSRPTTVEDSKFLRSVALYSESEVSAYEHNFGVARDRLHVMGIGRHEDDWVDYVVERSEELHQLPFPDFAFVISRPAGKIIPIERKIASLRALHEVAWVENGIPLVLRTHPKEADDGTIEIALPGDEHGYSWATSSAHPFHLARHSRFGVAFYSGVTVDLVALGVPSIELLDVRGLPKYDYPGLPRDNRGRPLFSQYRRTGLVIPADDAEDLRSAVHRILTDRGAAIGVLQNAYRMHFADPTGSTARLLRMIER